MSIWNKIGAGAIKKLNERIAKSVTKRAGQKEIDIYSRIHRDWLKKESKKLKKYKTPPLNIGGKK